MAVLIEGINIPEGNPITINIYRDGTWVNAYTTENGKAVPVPQHGRLIDESKISLAKYEQAAHDALHNGKGSILYDSGVLAGARAITQLVRRAPTVIPGSEEAE